MLKLICKNLCLIQKNTPWRKILPITENVKKYEELDIYAILNLKEKEMRRENELFYKNKTIALLNDCVYYCWQNKEINDEESEILENFLKELDKGK